MRTVVAVALAASCGLGTSAASAQAVRFSWDGPACSDAGALFQTRLQGLLTSAELERLSGRARVTAQGSRYSVSLLVELDGQSAGQRQLEAPSCPRAAETAAVAVAMATYAESQPRRVTEPPRPPRPAQDVWSQRAEPVPSFGRERPTPVEHPSRWQRRLGLFGVLQGGVLPAAAASGAIELGLGFGGRWSLTALGSVGLAQERRFEERQTAVLRLLSAALRGCGTALERLRFRLDGCVGAQLLQVQGHGEGFDTNRSASLTTFAPSLGVDGALRLSRALEWRVELEGSLPLSRRSFLVDTRPIARARALSWCARSGPVLRF